MIKAVIFDWGGVIAKEKNGGWRTAFQTLTGLPSEEASKVWAEAYQGLNTGTIDENTFWEKVEHRLGHQLPASKYDLWMDGIADETWPEMLEFAKELRSNGIKTAVLSNTVQMISKQFRSVDIYAGFEPVILSDEVGIAKPDIHIYELMLTSLSMHAENCVFVDDVPRNLEPAREMGMEVVLADSDPSKTVAGIRSFIEAKLA